MGDKGKGKIRYEIGKVSGVIAEEPTTDSLGKRYGEISGWTMAPGKAGYCLWLVGLCGQKCRSLACQ